MSRPEPSKIPRTLRQSTSRASRVAAQKRYAQNPVFSALRDALAGV